MNLEFKIKQCQEEKAQMQMKLNGIFVCGYDVLLSCEYQGKMVAKADYTGDIPFSIKHTESDGYFPCEYKKNNETLE